MKIRFRSNVVYDNEEQKLTVLGSIFDWVAKTEAEKFSKQEVNEFCWYV